MIGEKLPQKIFSINRNIDPMVILRIIATQLHCPVETLFKVCRERRYVETRFIAILIFRELLPQITLVQLGKLFSQHHTTIMNAQASGYNLLKNKDLHFTYKYNKASRKIAGFIISKKPKQIIPWMVQEYKTKRTLPYE